MQLHGKVATCLLFSLAGAVLFAAAATAGGEKNVKGPSVLVQSAVVRLLSMKRSILAYGTVEYAPEHSRVEDLQGEGVVKEVLVSVGQPVHAGDPLLRLLPTANASMEIERARLDLVFARKTLDRLTELRGRRLATNAEVQTAEETLSKSQAVLAELRKRYLGEQGLLLRAGTDGVVEAVLVREGQIAVPGAPLLRLADGSRLRIRLGVEAEDVQRVRIGQEVRIRPMYPGAKPVIGRIGEVFRQVNPQTRLAEIIVPLPAVDGLLPGGMVRGEIFSRTDSRVPAVPRTAVLYEGSKGYVFVVERGVARRRFVDVGRADGQFVEIRKGLDPGDTVVTVGNYELADGMAVRFQGSR